MNNKIEAVNFVRKIREKQYQDISCKNHKEIITYFKEKAALNKKVLVKSND